MSTKKGSWTDVFLMFFTSNGITSSTIRVGERTVYMLLYIFLPLIILFVISFFFKRVENQTSEQEHVNLLPQLNEEEKLEFLDSYFSNENRDYVENYLTINRDISIIRDYMPLERTDISFTIRLSGSSATKECLRFQR